ncbi:class I SAM-dependent methyltransferase [Phytoactinopolyspora halotolerans]|uniref:Class I SAM-dependent methyltransferase n=1 Tax=Phytoactinopolyspora halotolerans TaxID=1981512 RepID=A0A6L9SJI9_9ACTN|nr:class I SAM-dependent methyltransferase [Phytoactinopolyspora halotolerans]NEE04250.1 class I SAM-dependent methyltransferase [Phytoactinopolyspora halotolerans]
MGTTAHTSGRTASTAGRRSRRFAKLWRSMADSVDQQIRPAKSDLFNDVPAQIVEIGSGVGSNFGYLRPGTRVIAFEPNTYFHADLRAAAERHRIDLDLRAGDLRADTLPAASHELVISTLTLCSVDDVDSLLSEVRRILRPGGRLLFIEHVAAAPGSARARYQRIVRRPWRALGDGCDPCNDTYGALERSGLTLTATRLEPLGSNLDPTNLTYWGTALRDS